MLTLHVNVATPYDIIIGRGLIGAIGKQVKIACPKAEKVCVISDNTVFAIYGIGACSSLEEEGFNVCSFVVPAGESSKSLENFGKGLTFLAEAGYKRSDAVVALGGGVVGDLAGFIAASYMRGISVVQVPTTLLAMVDSSVGGKTAVNLSVGKNLAGAFHEPKLVVTDTAILDTQTNDNMQCGLGELLKYAFLSDGRIKELISNGMTASNVDEIIYLAVKYKAEVVERDEKEGGIRKLLNLGHTFGHAYERLSGFAVPHGKCVAMGLFDSINISKKLGFLSEEKADLMCDFVRGSGYSPCANMNIDSVLECIKSDKKVQNGGVVDFVVIKDFGCCTVVPLTFEELKKMTYGR